MGSRETASPVVSVLMAVRNGERYLTEAMDAIRTQTLEDWELVAVLDHSADGSEKLLKSVADARFRVTTLSRGRGVSAALNAGLSLCRAPLVAHLDADDVCFPERLTTQLRHFSERPDLGVLGSAAMVIDGHSRRVGTITPVTGARVVARRLLWRNCLVHSSVMFRRAVVEAAGGYDLRCQLSEDYQLWLRCVAFGQVDNLSEPLVSYRLHSGQRTRAPAGARAYLGAVAEARRSAAQSLGVTPVGCTFRQSAWLAVQIARQLPICGLHTSLPGSGMKRTLS